GEVFGRIVFNTSVSGYQEILTNPSANGQVISITYPEIGAYGVNGEDSESVKVHAAGLIVKRGRGCVSNWRATGTLEDFLVKNGVTAADNIDTRKLLRHIRKNGEQKCILTTRPAAKNALLKKLKDTANPADGDLIKRVSTAKKYAYDSSKKLVPLGLFPKEAQYLKVSDNKINYKVAVIDCGVKTSLLAMLASANCEPVVFPATVKAAELLKGFNGVLVSNGPGDPEAAPYVAETVNEILGKVPVLGIGMGCQLLAIALGGRTYRMVSGHRGGNHSVKNTMTGAVEVVSQNHGYAIDGESFDGSTSRVRITHVNLNDMTVEGIEAASLKAFGVLYYPQAGPGAHDASYVFNRFIGYMKNKKGAK
ncbi:MAG: glutamine-hydrolyzing carbamoyl-phosphate synthase small subunit, partial [Spirochaetia bacterium]|nr:glutamine-hydrolyzing carbamoyl-phosphate synthase small subunit [Spirochaetia bacterium]